MIFQQKQNITRGLYNTSKILRKYRNQSLVILFVIMDYCPGNIIDFCKNWKVSKGISVEH